MTFKAKINLLALSLCGVLTGFWMIVLAKGYYYFAFGQTHDLAYNAQLLWDMGHGSLSPSQINANFLTDHCYFWAFLVAPLYWIDPDPMLLQYLKIGMFTAGCYIFYLILKKHINPLIALGAMIAYSLAPANMSMLLGFFNYETFAVPLVFLIFKALDDDNIKLYLVSCFLLCLVKEQMPLLVAAFGLMAFFFKKDKINWAMVPFVAGLLFFIFEIFILTPYLRRDLPVSIDHYWARYAQYGQTPHAILFYLLMHPSSLLKQFISTPIINWYNGLFGFWGGLGFLSPQILFIALPLFLKNILSSNYQEHDIFFLSHYSCIFPPFIFLASWNTLNHIQNKWRNSIHALALCFMFIHAFVFIPPHLGLFHPKITTDALAKQHLIDKIPPNASVLTSMSTYTPLANRRQVLPLFVYLTGHYLVSGEKFKLNSNIDYLLLNLSHEWVLDANPRKYIPFMMALNLDDRWRLIKSIEDMALYVKNPLRLKADHLIETSSAPFLERVQPKIFDHTLKLDFVDYPQIFPQPNRILPVTMYWQSLKKTKVRYKIFLRIISTDGRTYYSKFRDIGSIIYPTYCWSQSQYIKESYNYLLPSMPMGRFMMRLWVYNPVSRRWLGEMEYKFRVAQPR